MSALTEFGFQTLTAAVAATGVWIVSRLRSPIKFEMHAQRERGFSVRDIRLSFYWKPGRTRRGFEWALYLSRKSLPPTGVPSELALPSLSKDA